MPKSIPLAEVKIAYFNWLDMALPKVASQKLKGVMICLYENDFFQAQVLGYESVDPNDNDWACKWKFDEKEIFDFQSERFAKEWEVALEKSRKWTDEYILSGRTGAAAIRDIGILALGFADGDIEFRYPENMKNEN
jgi:hypothetical protein